MAHPDPTGPAGGELRFILSLRATGNGHISSIEFRSGILRADYSTAMDEALGFVTAPTVSPNPPSLKTVFLDKCHTGT